MYEVLALASFRWWSHYCTIWISAISPSKHRSVCYCSSTSTQWLHNTTSCMTSSIIYYYSLLEASWLCRGAHMWSSSVASSRVSNIRRIKKHTQVLTYSFRACTNRKPWTICLATLASILELSHMFMKEFGACNYLAHNCKIAVIYLTSPNMASKCVMWEGGMRGWIWQWPWYIAQTIIRWFATSWLPSK